MMTPPIDHRLFAEEAIKEIVGPFVPEDLKIYLGSKPKAEDPDYYVAILTEEEEQMMPGTRVWILAQSVVLVCSLGARDSAEHVRYREHLRAGLNEMERRQNWSRSGGKFYGGFIERVARVDKDRHHGDIFYLETRVAVA